MFTWALVVMDVWGGTHFTTALPLFIAFAADIALASIIVKAFI